MKHLSPGRAVVATGAADRSHFWHPKKYCGAAKGSLGVGEQVESRRASELSESGTRTKARGPNQENTVEKSTDDDWDQ